MARYGRGRLLSGEGRAGSHNRGAAVPNLQFHPVHYDVVILGGGYAGLMAALRLSAWYCPVTALLINETNVFTERVRLQEALAAQLGQRLPPLDRWLADTKVDFLRGSVVAIDGIAGTVVVEQENRQFGVAFDRCIYALGSATDVEHVPGVAQHAFRLDPGNGPRAAAALRKRLQDAPESSQVVIV